MTKVYLLVDDEVDAFATRREEKVLQRHRSVVSVDDVTRLVVQVTDPLAELSGVGDCGRQEHVVYIVWQQDQRFFPYHSSFLK